MTNIRKNINVSAQIILLGYQPVRRWQAVIHSVSEALNQQARASTLRSYPPTTWQLPPTPAISKIATYPLLQCFVVNYEMADSQQNPALFFSLLKDQLRKGFTEEHWFIVSHEDCVFRENQNYDSDVISKLVSFCQEERRQRKTPLHLLGGTQWMGIINATPDSFSDGGINNDLSTLKQSVNSLLHEGAAIIDLGGQSTRPGADILDIETEWSRIKPAISAIRELLQDWAFTVDLSIDTYHPEIAHRSIMAGATMINDVSGLTNPAMRQLVREFPNISWVAMHHLGLPANKAITMNTALTGEELVDELNQWSDQLLDSLTAENSLPDRLYFDPGIGFGKNAKQNALILQHSHRLNHARAWLIGHSRKSYLNPILNSTETIPRDIGTVASTISLIEQGCPVIRVHNVELSRLAERSYLATRSVSITNDATT